MEKVVRSGVWRFANVQFDESRLELKVDGQPQELDAKPRAVLLTLLRAEGDLVTKDEFLSEVWVGQDVSESALSQAVKRLRVVLGDDQRKILATVHGLGFRLNVPIAYEEPSDSQHPNATTTANALIPGEVLTGRKNWTLVERLQARANNELWLARHQDGQHAVVKVALSSRAERALRREATLNRVLMAELQEPCMAPMLDWQFEEQPGWIMMPWYAAGNISEWSHKSYKFDALSLQQRVDIITKLALTLSDSHAIGVLHRDIKPGNLLVDDRGPSIKVLLSDFGNGSARSQTRLIQTGVTITGFSQTLTDATATHQISGTPAYLAPEVISGGAFTEQADIYSLGIVLYQLAAGAMNRPLAPGWEEDVPDPSLRELIAKACAGRPERRFSTMQEMAEQLSAWKAPELAHHEATSDEAPPADRRRGRIAVIASILLVSGLAVLVSLTKQAASESPTTPTDSALSADSGQPGFIFLPFELDGIEDNQQLALHGLQDALIEDLNKLQGSQLIRGNQLFAMGVTAEQIPTLGKTLNVTHIIKGSFERKNNTLLARLQRQDLQSSDVSWSFETSKPIDELYSLQQALFAALSEVLGEKSATVVNGPAPHQRGYADYLAALAFYQRDGAYSESSALEFLRLSDIALASNPHLAAAHLLAIRGTIDAFDSSAIDVQPARTRVNKSLLQLENLGTPAAMLAFAHAYRSMYLDWDAKQALDIFEPYWNELSHLPYVLVFYANLLEGTGELERLTQLLAENTNVQPTDIGSIDYLANFHFIDRKDALTAMRILAAAKNRFPQDDYLPYLYILFGVYATGDEAWIQKLLDITSTQSASSLRYLRPRLNKAFRENDQNTLLRLVEQIPPSGFRTNGFHGLRPNALTRARVLDAANASPQRVYFYAQQALDALNKRRQQSDSPNRMASASMALALLGRKEEALRLIDQALQQMPASRNEQGYDSLMIRAIKVFAQTQQDERLMAGLKELYGPGGYTEGDCWGDFGSVLAAPIMRRPQATAWLQKTCGTWQQSNRDALKSYLP